MARPRFRIGRIFAVFVAFVLFCLLMELNRLLPGGWPGGGGQGGIRKAGTLDTGDAGGSRDAENAGAAALAEPEGRPPIELPREGVLIELRGTDGTYFDEWSFGQGDLGGKDHVLSSRHGRHVSKDAKLIRDGFRAEAKPGSLFVQTPVADVEPGHWIVVMPDPLPPRARKASRVRIDVVPPAGGDLAGSDVRVRITRPGSAPEDLPVDGDGGVTIKAPRGPTMVTPVVDGVAGAAHWVSRWSSTDVTIEAPRPATDRSGDDRLILVPPGETRFAARFARPAGEGRTEPEPEVVLPTTEANGATAIRVPNDVPVDVLVDEPGKQPYAESVPPGRGAANVKPQAEVGGRLAVVVKGPEGKFVGGAMVVAGVAADPFLAIRHARTRTTGRAELKGIPTGPVGVFVAAPGLATRRVLVDAPTDGPVEVTLERGYALRVLVTDRQGLPVSGASVDLEPEDGGAPVPLAPRPTSGVMPDVGTERVALGWGSAETNDNGGWSAAGLRAARYTLRVHAPGYGRVTVREVRPGPSRTYFVTLLRRDG